jgi:hypothetical protein
MSQSISDPPRYCTSLTPRVTALVAPAQPWARGEFLGQVLCEGARVVAELTEGPAPASHVVVTGESTAACRAVLQAVVEGAVGARGLPGGGGSGDGGCAAPGAALALAGLAVVDAFALPGLQATGEPWASPGSKASGGVATQRGAWGWDVQGQGQGEPGLSVTLAFAHHGIQGSDDGGCSHRPPPPTHTRTRTPQPHPSPLLVAVAACLVHLPWLCEAAVRKRGSVDVAAAA